MEIMIYALYVSMAVMRWVWRVRGGAWQVCYKAYYYTQYCLIVSFLKPLTVRLVFFADIRVTN